MLVETRPSALLGAPGLLDAIRAIRSRTTAIAVVAFLLLPLWAAGIFGRGYWTPDEPREADIVWRMSQSGPQAIPELAGAPFLEKPPLAYWLASAFVDAPGAPAWRARLPNLAYALIVAACIVLLAYEMSAAGGAIMAAVAAGSFMLVYQVGIWLATDAALMAAVALSLLGLYCGYHSARSEEKLAGYTLMHVGLAVGFMSKSAAAWLVPGCALISLILWDRNFRELLRWQLYAGALIEALCIVPWIFAVYDSLAGASLFREAMWGNLIGRFMHLRDLDPAMHQYAGEHRNWVGKYWLEAPLYLLPWTFLVIAAARRGWKKFKTPNAITREWRFCVVTVVPALVLLSFSVTARGIYAAPALIGVGLALALWMNQLDREADAFDLRMIRWTTRVLAVLGLVLLTALPLAMVFIRSTALSYAPLILGACVVLGGSTVLLMHRHALSPAPSGSLAACYLSYLLIFIGGALIYFPPVNARSNLSSIAEDLRADLEQRPLVLIGPDETTRAFVDLGKMQASVIDSNAANLEKDIAHISAQQPQAGFLMMRTSRHGPISAWLQAHRHSTQQRRGDSSIEAASNAGLRIEREYSLPEGRSYVLLSKPVRQ